MDRMTLNESLWLMLILGDYGADPEEAIARIRVAKEVIAKDRGQRVSDINWDVEYASSVTDDIIIMASRNGAVDIFALPGDV